jgi:hypothetical protein
MRQSITTSVLSASALTTRRVMVLAALLLAAFGLTELLGLGPEIAEAARPPKAPNGPGPT